MNRRNITIPKASFSVLVFLIPSLSNNPKSINNGLEKSYLFCMAHHIFLDAIVCLSSSKDPCVASLLMIFTKPTLVLALGHTYGAPIDNWSYYFVVKPNQPSPLNDSRSPRRLSLPFCLRRKTSFGYVMLNLIPTIFGCANSFFSRSVHLLAVSCSVLSVIFSLHFYWKENGRKLW